jgi:hypothetical protein
LKKAARHDPGDDRGEQRRRRAALARLEREEGAVVEGLGALHDEREELERQMIREEVYRDAAKMRQIKRRLGEIESEEQELTRRWEAVDAARGARMG